MSKIIKKNKSIIPACDVTLEKFEEIVKQTEDIDKIGAYKIGFSLGLRYGLPKVVEIARKYTSKPLIYDHQKAATDIPDTGEDFAKIMDEASINAVILFPQAGPSTQEAWIKALQKQGLGVIVGGLMTHPQYISSERGYLNDEAIIKIYLKSAALGVTDFVVPGNKPDFIKKIKAAIESKGINPVFYAPGFVAQGGEISDAGKVAGDCWHAIVGRGIYKAENIKKSALELTSKL
jgi:orotidine-5'-phosphate decarboxylase